MRARLWLTLGVLVSGALTAWALGSFLDGGAPRDVLRAGLSFGLTAAMAVAIYRLRPRAGWGVEVSAVAVKVARPRGQSVIELGWADITGVRRLGARREVLSLWLGEQRRVLVPAFLFPRRADFEALASELEARMPEAARPRPPLH